MSEPREPLTPSQEVAQRIVAKLIEKGLFSEDALDPRMVDRIAAGKISQEDWKLEIEKSLDRTRQSRG